MDPDSIYNLPSWFHNRTLRGIEHTHVRMCMLHLDPKSNPCMLAKEKINNSTKLLSRSILLLNQHMKNMNLLHNLILCIPVLSDPTHTQFRELYNQTEKCKRSTGCIEESKWGSKGCLRTDRSRSMCCRVRST